MNTRALFLAGATTLASINPLLTTTAFSQTPLNGDINQTLPPPPGANSVPVSQGRIDQAKRQNDGEFDHMARPEQNEIWVGGRIQEAWSDSIETEGVYTYQQCETCTYKVRTRELMVSSIVLPRTLQIHSFDVGDANNFQVKKRADNILTVLPGKFGTDTSMIVYGTDGSVWPFYIRAEGTNSYNVPDLKVVINGDPELEDKPVLMTAVTSSGQKTRDTFGPAFNDPTTQSALSELAASASGKAGNSKTPAEPAGPEDYVQSVPIDPDKFHGWADYELWGSEDETLRPKAVFRDDHFTYIQFGENWNKVELPTAYVVVDEIDEVVNTRVQGRTYIIESNRSLITLKSGESYLCIRYTGDDA